LAKARGSTAGTYELEDIMNTKKDYSISTPFTSVEGLLSNAHIQLPTLMGET